MPLPTSARKPRGRSGSWLIRKSRGGSSEPAVHAEQATETFGLDGVSLHHRHRQPSGAGRVGSLFGERRQRSACRPVS